jgi:predicted glycosyltransferase
MAGYNTVCEVLSSGRPAILVPRATPVLEQLIRARRFARMGCVDMVEPAQLTPGRLIRKVLDVLANPQRPRATVDLRGLSRVGERTAALLEGLAA